MSQNTNTTTTLTLVCPKLSRGVHLVAREDEKIDLGCIARMFGLDPRTVKLNGYFLSRGIDFLACSMTWKSLLSFFAKRGMATGSCGDGGLVVDGKVLKSGYKRPHGSTNGIPSMKPNIEDSSKKTKVKDPGADRGSRKRFISNASNLKRKQEDIEESNSSKKPNIEESNIEESNSSKKTKVKDPGADRGSRKRFISNASNLKRKQEDIEESNPSKKPNIEESNIEESNSSKKTKVKDPGADRGSRKRFISNASNLKRKQEDILSSLKKLKVDESGMATRERTCSESLFKTGIPCSFLGVNMKRMREDEMVLPASCKKVR